MHIHILGICGTFMGGIAAIAKQLGHKVTGSDKNVYPPMSTQLEELGITLYQGYDEAQFNDSPDMVVIGNAMSRGNPAVEYVLNRNLPYTSGPQWLLENLLKDRWVLAVSGTHGKTTTSSMLAWILEHAGLKPGFLIGGIPENFGISARLGEHPFFVIEADEYDTAFFDKRSKFVHYRPKTLVLNNLEFDHADIFEDLAAIQKQFHHLLRMVPGNGLLVRPHNEPAIDEVVEMGFWSEQQQLGKDWTCSLKDEAGSHFSINLHGEAVGTVHWNLMGMHNVSNAIMAIAAARHVGVSPVAACQALSEFQNVKRRMELRGTVNNIAVYDDFAHHPTAIATTVEGLRSKVGTQRILAILEPRSNTMKMGIHKSSLVESWQHADEVFVFEPEGLDWSIEAFQKPEFIPCHIHKNFDELLDAVVASAKSGDHILVMSNGGFGGIHAKLLTALAE